jgi:hypothetical protein
VARLRSRIEERVWKILTAAASLETRSKLESLLLVADGEHQSLLDRLRKGPYRRSAPELYRAQTENRAGCFMPGWHRRDALHFALGAFLLGHQQSLNLAGSFFSGTSALHCLTPI